jgi:hypothetical protein
MSRRPIALSLDLLRLQNEGYDLEIRGGFLLVRNIPYVDDQCIVKTGTLISTLVLTADKTDNPVADHVAHWVGSHPCHADGSRIAAIENPSRPQDLGHGIRTDFTFSAKAAYRDYHHKILTYIGRITGEATLIDPEADARIFSPIPADDPDNVFKYIDTASSRAGIDAVNEKLAGLRIGIAGLGGTGAYILDLVAKTWVKEIRIFDGDEFSQHNAFRAPGAPSFEHLQERPHKVNHYEQLYSQMRNGIVAHDVFLDETNLDLLDGLDFVFVCIDRGLPKRIVIERLVANGTPFVDVGMGVVLDEGRLSGIVRLTTSTRETRAETAAHISYSDDDGEANEYASKIQIAELNALNAVMAVIRWKRLFGVYEDRRKDHYAGYSIPSGEIILETPAP